MNNSKNHHTHMQRMVHAIRNTFLNGLLTILPFAITVAIFAYTTRIIQSLLAPIHELEPAYLQMIPYSELILAVMFIFIIGIIFKTFLLRSLLHIIESTFFKLPLMQPIYFGVKQLIQAFTVKDKFTFKRVVLVEFPRKNLYSIGFLTSQVPKKLSPHTNQPFLCIFIPTTPNPTSGYLVLVSQDEIIDTDLTRQEAMSLIISGGIVQPERYLP